MLLSIVAGIGFVLMSIPNPAFIVASTLLSISFGMSRNDYMVHFIARHSDAEIRATVLSIAGMGKRLLTVALNPVVGYAFSLFGGHVLVIIGAMLVLLPFVTTRRLERG